VARLVEFRQGLLIGNDMSMTNSGPSMYEVLCVDLKGGKGIFLSLGSVQVIRNKESKAVGIKPHYLAPIFNHLRVDPGFGENTRRSSRCSHQSCWSHC